MDKNARIQELETALNFLRLGVLSIQNATIEGRVCDDVAWYDEITTLHDFCAGLVEHSATGQLDLPLQGVTHWIVRQGETLSSIAEAYYGDVGAVDKIAQRNGLADPDMIVAGQVLELEAIANPIMSAHTRGMVELEAKLASADQRLEASRNERKQLEKERDAMRWRLLNATDGIMLLADRAGATVQELAQLGLATYVKDKAGNAHAVFSTLDDLAEASDSEMKHQATTAKFRQLKQHFVTHQRTVTVLLDRLKSVTMRNTISKEDVQSLRDLRDDLSATIRREI